jgi:hypothetical protein
MYWKPNSSYGRPVCSVTAQNTRYRAAMDVDPSTAAAAPNGGSRALAVARGRHAARLVFKSASTQIAESVLEDWRVKASRWGAHISYSSEQRVSAVA